MKDTWDAPPDPLEALQEGNRSPYEDFVRSAAGELMGFFRRLGAPPADAEDLAQEVFLKMYRSHHTYKPEGRFRAFVLRTARNAWVDRARRRGSRPRTVAPGAYEEGDSWENVADEQAAEPGAALQGVEVRGRVQAALSALGENHRVVFELGMVQELPYAHIAEVLEVPVGTIKSRMFHAVRKLRELLGEDEA